MNVFVTLKQSKLKNKLLLVLDHNASVCIEVDSVVSNLFCENVLSEDL